MLKGVSFNTVRYLYSGLIALLTLIAALLAFAFFAAPFLASNKAYRDWRVRQTRALTNDISMRVEGTYILPGNGYRTLRIWSRWLGDNPDDRYLLRASIRTTAEFKDTLPMPYWYVPLTPDFRTKREPLFLWEFHAPQGSPERIWLRVYFRHKNSDEAERWVDFDFPYFQTQDPASPSDSIHWRDVLSTSN
jgi:hypothetical protein